MENKLGIVAAAAGVDASNTPQGTVLLLPVDPDASAREIATGLRARLGVRVGVIVSDTLGRAWREGQTDAAIGAAGVHVFEDLRGATDAEGRPLVVTMPCVADELAAATDLVKGKATRLPVAVVRGRADLVGDLDLPGARSIVRIPSATCSAAGRTRPTPTGSPRVRHPSPAADGPEESRDRGEDERPRGDPPGGDHDHGRGEDPEPDPVDPRPARRTCG